jgi:RNA polymerase sigma-70 factor (ECF subfamily)
MKGANDEGTELQELSSRAAAGDQSAFRALVDETHGVAYRLALRMVGSNAEAEDVVQETYVRVWKGLSKIRDHGAVLGWICSVTRNVAVDRIRYQRRRKADSLDREVAEGMGPLVDTIASDDSGPEEAASSEQFRSAVREMVASLKEKHRTVLLLREVDGMSYEELSEALGIPVGTVESRLHRARKELAGKLDRLHKQHARESK